MLASDKTLAGLALKAFVRKQDAAHQLQVIVMPAQVAQPSMLQVGAQRLRHVFTPRHTNGRHYCCLCVQALMHTQETPHDWWAPTGMHVLCCAVLPVCYPLTSVME